ncbi:MAG: NAD(P)/FAD-dependent oxidoreductase [Planctomycetaceae bacterium]|nr:NAD(P)/FAD-dependent oxidoreductase [Planctomycetaceae bacterium]MCP4463154.1 NAD(P)/FAD-dependent oxidoreductase [Planctomycetaceae bacterium]MDG1806827.1 NAD(P)/FAD-dependent oxidoreductase [Pirellulaceae bacterium]MDG2102776.1 NAD(P)/FAD-dependent oxidoreductase [Pirellulaceae bacterium]
MKYDAIVIGGGHNGLVNGAYLAKSGLKTLILERRPMVGGAAITEELLPGYQFTTFSYAISLIRPDIVQDLQLVKHGMMVLPMSSTFQPGYDGEYLLLGADKDHNFHEICRHSREDAESYRDLSHLFDRVCFALKPLLDAIPPNALSDRPEDVAHCTEVRNYLQNLPADVQGLIDRLWNGSAADILNDYFECELLKSNIASSAIIGSMISPSDKKSGIVWLLHKMGEYDGVFGDWGFHKGGNGGFTQVLARAAQAWGATVMTGHGVERVIYDSGKVEGVVLDNGQELRADIVVSALDPKRTFTQLVDAKDLPVDLNQAITQFKFQGSASKVNFALNGLPRFPALSGRADPFTGFVNVGPSMQYLEDAFADAKAGRFSRKPFVDCCVQSTVDPDMSPPGKHVMSCFVMYTPYHLADGAWATEREKLGDTVENTLNEFFPGFPGLVEHREIVTPLDIENVTGLTEGNIFMGELFSEQMFLNRPAPGWNQYRTPIEGYYQCGSGTHPGGCVMGAPGKLAARQVLNDRQQKEISKN